MRPGDHPGVPRAGPRPGAPLRARLLAAILCAAMALAALELGLKLLAPLHMAAIPEAYMYDPAVGARLRPGIHLLRATDHLQEIRTNALGTVNFEETFKGYRRLVFCLGDSNTQGTGLPADASYPFQLAMSLNLDSEGLYRREAGVVNLGAGAFGVRQSGLLLERYAGLIGKPDAALLLVTDNDYDDDRLFESGYRHGHLVTGSPRWKGMARPLLLISRLELVKRAKVALNILRRRALLGAARRGHEETARLLWPAVKAVHGYCEANGIRLIVSWAHHPSAGYGWMKSAAVREGIAFADWAPSVDSVRAASPGLPLENPHSAGHMRGWVARLIAEAFARQLRPADAAEGVRRRPRPGP